MDKSKYKEIIKSKEEAMIIQIQETDELRKENLRLKNVVKKLNDKISKCDKKYTSADMEQFAEWLLDNGYEKHPKFHRLYGKVYDSVLKLISQLREMWETETGRRVK